MWLNVSKGDVILLSTIMLIQSSLGGSALNAITFSLVKILKSLQVSFSEIEIKEINKY